jgi:hypothetical protein
VKWDGFDVEVCKHEVEEVSGGATLCEDDRRGDQKRFVVFRLFVFSSLSVRCRLLLLCNGTQRHVDIFGRVM